jgi:hypothetical protein
VKTVSRGRVALLFGVAAKLRLDGSEPGAFPLEVCDVSGVVDRPVGYPYLFSRPGSLTGWRSISPSPHEFAAVRGLHEPTPVRVCPRNKTASTAGQEDARSG